MCEAPVSESCKQSMRPRMDRRPRHRDDGEVTDARVPELIAEIGRRADRWTTNQTLAVPGEMTGWWHVAWDRISDVAFSQSVAPTPDRAAWLQSEVVRLCALDPDEWLGPWFRAREQPSIGVLETAHVSLAVTTALRLCPDLFDRDQIGEALLERAVHPLERALDSRERSPQLNNWYHVMLNGYGSAVLELNDDDRIATLPDRMRRAAEVTEGDSYGESVQYWGYAARHLTHLDEVLRAQGRPTDPAVLDSVSRCVPWVAQSVMFADVQSTWGPGHHLAMINFGDSAITARPPAEVLLHVARYGDDPHAGVARWLFDQAYRDLDLVSQGLSSFGFFNQVDWRSVDLLSQTAPPVSPAEAGIPRTDHFDCGTAVLRDETRDQTVLAVKGGHGPITARSHRHRDAGSFVLGHAGEVLFTDPGHCCYRLPAYQTAQSEESHSTWTIRDGYGTTLPQQRIPDGFGQLTAPTAASDLPGFDEVSTEIAQSYGAPVHVARRKWLFRPPHLVLIIDEVVACEPVSVESRFVINNRDGQLKVNQATDTRTVIRRNDVAAKFFLLDAETDGEVSSWPITQEYSVLHDVYDPLPNAQGQGKEGSGLNLVATTPLGRRHRALWSIIVDAESAIRSWHLDRTPDGLQLGHPDRSTEQIILATIPW